MKALIVGADGGLGSEIADQLIAVLDVSDVLEFEGDLLSFEDIRDAISEQPKNISVVIYCAGVNLISKFENCHRADFQESMQVNCYGFVQVIQQLMQQGKLAPGAKACLVTSNAANVPMTHSLSYNCSKAAANMAIRQMAREIPASELCVFGVAPNKLAGTPMSRKIEEQVIKMRGWTPEQAKKYQLSALPAKMETSPAACAYFIKQLCTEDEVFYPYIHGTIIPFGGPQ